MVEDKLSEMFKKQKELMDRLQVAATIDDIRTMTLAAMVELGEMIQELNWKPWKHGTNNIANAREELIDVFHFVLELAIMLGMDSDEFADTYFKKMDVNHKRQDSGY